MKYKCEHADHSRTTSSPMSEDLLRLAERVEKLEGPDRKVDARICIASGMSRGNVMAGADGWCINSISNPNPYKSPSYTASIDDAMTLVPKGYGWCLYSDGYAGCAPYDPEQPPDGIKCGATPALALTAASLRARASIGKGE
ncbi:MAG: hypothetical protein AB7E60_05340 [Sphingobium sp.]